ncbi:MAG: PadR family transcriptional regulator [Spirochaetales bacterium]|jgi:PadR family transcriptional regulator, regulatory protein PadR|nr:PadR family transcriptional regulator [Spirochaetales bacterium]
MLGAKECAILGAISERPIHGYDLIRNLIDRGYEEWTEISMPSVYRLIGALERGGLVKGELDGDTRGAPKKVYTLTDDGRSALGESLLGHLENPVGARCSFDLGVAHIEDLDRLLANAAIARRLEDLDSRYKVMTRRRKLQRPIPWNVEALFYHGELKYKAEKKYLEYLLEKLKD